MINESEFLTEGNYTFGGPGIPAQKQHTGIQRGLASGWMATVYIGFIHSWKKK